MLPECLVVLFSPPETKRDTPASATAVLGKSSARREKHDVWGTNFALRSRNGDVVLTACSVHLVAKILKAQSDSVYISH